MVNIKMSEAEVSLRLAIYLIKNNKVKDNVEVAIDGAQVKVGKTLHFDVKGFLADLGWLPQGELTRWQSEYINPSYPHKIIVHSQSGCGDVTTTLTSGHQLFVEAKKGDLVKSKSSSEYKLLREALGQLLTLESIPENTVLAVAVPHGEKFKVLADKWRHAPLIQLTSIQIVTVSRNGEIEGLDVHQYY